MSDDRLDDLGSPRRSAADRFADLDKREPEQDAQPQPPRRPANRYSWVVGIVFLVAIIAASINQLSATDSAVGPEPGDELPEFAAPSATGTLDGDANVRASDGKGSDEAGGRPACQVRGPEIVNLCQLRERPLVLTFFFTRAADCEPHVDTLDRMRTEFPQVNFAAVIVREPKDDAARIVREHGWGLPVALDRDGVVSNIYRVIGCPTTVFAYSGGEVRETRVGGGGLTEAKLRTAVGRLLRQDRRRRR